MDFRDVVMLFLAIALFISTLVNFVLLGKRVTEGHLENEDVDYGYEWDLPEEEEPVRAPPKKVNKQSQRKSGARKKKAA